LPISTKKGIDKRGTIASPTVVLEEAQAKESRPMTTELATMSKATTGSAIQTRRFVMPTLSYLSDAVAATAVQHVVEGALHGVIDSSAKVSKFCISLVSNMIISPVLWWTTKTTGYLMYCAALRIISSSSSLMIGAYRGSYHYFIPTQAEPVLLIEDKKLEQKMG